MIPTRLEDLILTPLIHSELYRSYLKWSSKPLFLSPCNFSPRSCEDAACASSGSIDLVIATAQGTMIYTLSAIDLAFLILLCLVLYRYHAPTVSIVNGTVVTTKIQN